VLTFVLPAQVAAVIVENTFFNMEAMVGEVGICSLAEMELNV
jgi:hypothetical protein